MSSALFGIASGPDLLRLLAVPVFAWAAHRDVRTRRVPNRTWLPLLALAGVALAWDAWLLADAGAFQRRLYALQVAISVGLVGTLGYVFWRIGGFGGADAKAVITLSVLFPAYPVFFVLQEALPLYRADLGVFSLTILSNTVLLGLFYPVALALRNLPRGELTPAMFVGRPVAVADVPAEYGRLLETPAGFTRQGLDIDALRMYLRWRGVSLAQLRADPERYRHPLPTDRNEPGDGSIDDGATGDGPVEGGPGGTARTAPDGGEVDPGPGRRQAGGSSGWEPSLDGDLEPAVRPLDEWGAGRFLADHEAYGTTPEALREGLAVLTEPDRRTVWITPGIPFVVPIFVGLLVALTFGDLLFAILLLFGFV